MFESWGARENPAQKPRTCSREAEIATLRRRHFVSPAVRKPTLKSTGRGSSLLSGAPSTRWIGIVHPALASHGTWTPSPPGVPRFVCFLPSRYRRSSPVNLKQSAGLLIPGARGWITGPVETTRPVWTYRHRVYRWTRTHGVIWTMKV